MEYSETGHIKTNLKISSDKLNLEISDKDYQSEQLLGRILFLVILIIVQIVQLFTKTFSMSNHVPFYKNPVQELRAFPIFGQSIQIMLSITMFVRLMIFFKGISFSPYLFLLELPAVYSIYRFLKFSFGFLNKKTPLYALLINGMIFILISFYP